jgi:hypothetical protein
VWVTSLACAQVIRRFPRCSYELLHVFCFLLGFAHTYLGMGAAEMVRKSAVCAVLQWHGLPYPPRVRKGCTGLGPLRVHVTM